MLHSHGRGGAGNMADSSHSPKLTPKDLETPVLKTSVVTTGRGGNGNMFHNDDPIETRLRQDVAPVVRRSSQGAQHSGRGGAGNVDVPRKSSEHGEDDSRKSFDLDAVVHKGKTLLFGKK